MKAQTSVLLVFSLVLGISFDAGAASATWAGGATPGSTVWTTGADWSTASSNFPNGTSDIATFDSGVSALPTSTLSLGQNITLGGLVIKASSGTPTGTLNITDTNTLTIGTSTPINIGASQGLVLNVPTVFSATAATITQQSTSTLNFGGTDTITMGNNGTLTFSSGSTTIASTVTYTSSTGTAGLSLTNGAVVNFNSAATSPTGTVSVGSGTFNIGNKGESFKRITLGGGTSTAASVYYTGATNGYSQGAIVQFLGTSTTGTFTIGINSATANTTGTFSGISTLNNGSTGTMTDVFYANTSNTLTLGGAMASSTLGTLFIQKAGNGTAILSGATTFTGTTSVNAGTLILGNSAALQDTTLSTGGGGVISGINGTNTLTTVTFGGLTGSQNLVSQITGGYGSLTNVTLNTQSGVTGTYSGAISDGATGMTVTISGTGTQTFSGHNIYTGTTTVGSGASFFVTNTTGSGASGTGTGALSVARGAAFGGTGSSLGTANSSTTFAIGSATGSGTATVYVGQASASDANTSGSLMLQASSTTSSTIQNANLVFNLDSTTPGSGNQLNVGNTAIAFNTTPGVSNTTLTLNIQGFTAIAANTPYILIAGTAGGSANGGLGQYSGFTISGPNNEISGLTLSFGGSEPPAWYANSYLFLVNNGSNVDDIEVEVVPEPGTWAMMIGGLALLVFIQRRRGARNGDNRLTREKV